MEKKHRMACECAICTKSRKDSARMDVPILVGFLALWFVVAIILKMMTG